MRLQWGALALVSQGKKQAPPAGGAMDRPQILVERVTDDRLVRRQERMHEKCVATGRGARYSPSTTRVATSWLPNLVAILLPVQMMQNACKASPGSSYCSKFFQLPML